MPRLKQSELQKSVNNVVSNVKYLCEMRGINYINLRNSIIKQTTFSAWQRHPERWTLDVICKFASRLNTTPICLLQNHAQQIKGGP